MQEFIMRMKSTEQELMELIQTNTPMVMTALDSFTREPKIFFEATYDGIRVCDHKRFRTH